MKNLFEQISEKVSAYCSGQISLAEFKSWFVPATWEVENDESAHDLICTIELYLAEYSDKYRTESELKELLAAAVNQFTPALPRP